MRASAGRRPGTPRLLRRTAARRASAGSPRVAWREDSGACYVVRPLARLTKWERRVEELTVEVSSTDLRRTRGVKPGGEMTRTVGRATMRGRGTGGWRIGCTLAGRSSPGTPRRSTSLRAEEN